MRAAAAARDAVVSDGLLGSEFAVQQARSALFERLPADLQANVTFRHFYTDELDPHSSELSLRYFSLFIAYFCALCRLEGRRKHYLQTPSEKSGASFARAHSRARTIFRRLNASYGEILLKYNIHTEISYAAKPKVISKNGHTSIGFEESALGGRYAAGAKPLGPPRKKQRAFEYFADELRFYEELYVFTEQMLRCAFTDERLQVPIAKEVNLIFRGHRFDFGTLRREASIQKAAADLDAAAERGGDLKRNLRHLAEVLVAPARKISIKEAALQRTPLVASRFTSGKTNARKYDRPNPYALVGPASAGGVGSDSGPIAFPPNHRAVQSFLAANRPRRVTSAASASDGGSRRAPSPPPAPAGDGEKSTGKKSKVASTSAAALSPVQRPRVNAFLDKLQDFDVSDVTPRAKSPRAGSVDDDQLSDLAAGPSQGSYAFFAPSALRSANDAGGGASPAKRDRSGSLASGQSTLSDRFRSKATVVRNAQSILRRRSSPSAAAVLAQEEWQVAPIDPATNQEDWRAYNPMPEIDKVYQSLANGVVITQLSIPADILCTYDASGVLLSTGES